MIFPDHFQVKSSPLVHNLLILEIAPKCTRDFLIMIIQIKIMTNKQTNGSENSTDASRHKSGKGERH